MAETTRTGRRAECPARPVDVETLRARLNAPEWARRLADLESETDARRDLDVKPSAARPCRLPKFE